jgi:hypothetical protein
MKRVVLLAIALLCPAQTPDSDVIRREIAAVREELSSLQARLARLEAMLAQRPSAPAPASRLVPELPPAGVSSSRSRATTDAGTRQQCAATTKKGTRCLRLAQAGSSTCWQH